MTTRGWVLESNVVRDCMSKMCDRKVFQSYMEEKEAPNQERGNACRFTLTKQVIGHFL